jgi:hypothetical protein
MVHGYSLDPHPSANAAKEQFALVRIPRLKRERVPENQVKLMDDLQSALAQADATQHLYAAKVVGPARSSEGVYLYYLIDLYK